MLKWDGISRLQRPTTDRQTDYTVLAARNITHRRKFARGQPKLHRVLSIHELPNYQLPERLATAIL